MSDDMRMRWTMHSPAAEDCEPALQFTDKNVSGTQSVFLRVGLILDELLVAFDMGSVWRAWFKGLQICQPSWKPAMSAS